MARGKRGERQMLIERGGVGPAYMGSGSPSTAGNPRRQSPQPQGRPDRSTGGVRDLTMGGDASLRYALNGL
jgi:hypothetical protein